MRQAKRIQSLTKSPAIAPHVAKKITRYNAEFAKSEADVIGDVLEQRRQPIHGKGSWRRWVVGALQRAAWGLQRPQAAAWRRGHEPVPAPTVLSTRGFALFSRSGHSHVQRVRNALAEAYMRHQQVALESMVSEGAGSCIILELSFDETEQACSTDFRNEIVHVMTLHGRLLRRCGNDTERFELVLPPCVVESTASEHILAAVRQRLPLDLEALPNLAQQVVLLLNSDSGSSCLRLGRHLAATLPVPVLQSVCRMHQASLALLAILVLGRLPSPLFCACLLFRRRRFQGALRKLLRREVQRKFVISYTEPSQEDRKSIRAVAC